MNKQSLGKIPEEPRELRISRQQEIKPKDDWSFSTSSSKAASEKRRLSQYVTNTTLDDDYKGTAKQFILHFSEQFRQLEEISDPSEHFPPQIKLQLLQNAVRPTDDLRIVEILDEYQSKLLDMADLKA